MSAQVSGSTTQDPALEGMPRCLAEAYEEHPHLRDRLDEMARFLRRHPKVHCSEVAPGHVRFRRLRGEVEGSIGRELIF